MDMNKGMVILVGAGSGEPGLLTQAGAAWLRRANVIVYDRLIGQALLELAPAEAERIYVGKSADHHAMEQDQINRLLIDLCRQGKLVVRLKGGDGLVFGRGGEETSALREAGLAFRIVPGVTAALAAGAYAGIPLTDRRMASSVAMVTGHEDADKSESTLNWKSLAGIDTLVFYMGVANLPQIARRLMEAGKPEGTPAAVVANVSTPAQRTVTATLATIAQAAAEAGIAPPAMTIVGPVVELRKQLEWFESLPLFGQTVLVTRTRRQASELSAALAERGAEVIEAPTIVIEPPEDFAQTDAALGQVGFFDWLVLTSPNGVEAFFERFRAMGLDARDLSICKVAAVGPATAEALERRSIRPDLVPPKFTTQSLGETLTAATAIRGQRILLARADIATSELADTLRAAGAEVAEVTLYRTRCPESLPEEALAALRADRVKWITFTSSSTVENFIALLAKCGIDPQSPVLKSARLAAIGPVTADALRRHGMEPTVTADPHTIEALVEAITCNRAPGSS